MHWCYSCDHRWIAWHLCFNVRCGSSVELSCCAVPIDPQCQLWFYELSLSIFNLGVQSPSLFAPFAQIKVGPGIQLYKGKATGLPERQIRWWYEQRMEIGQHCRKGKFWDWFKFEIAINLLLPLSIQNRQWNGCVMDADTVHCGPAPPMCNMRACLLRFFVNFGFSQLSFDLEILLSVFCVLSSTSRAPPVKTSLLHILYASPAWVAGGY